MGDDTGLFHTYVDSNRVINGQTYYYTVVAYDRGFAGGNDSDFLTGIPPSETSKTITYNPTTDQYIFDVNSVRVVPRPETAGYVPPSIEATGGLVQQSGHGTGEIFIDIIDQQAVKEGGQYRIDFGRTDGQTTYSVIDDKPVSVPVVAAPGKFSSLGYQNILQGSFTLSRDGQPLEADMDYTLNAESGTVQISNESSVGSGEELTATFKYRPIAQSGNLASEESNLVFDGMHLFVQNAPLAINQEETGWTQGGDGLGNYEVRVATSGPVRVAQPSDYEITFSNDFPTTSISNNVPLPFTVVNLTRANQEIDVFRCR
jgi:hypothetical protein